MKKTEITAIIFALIACLLWSGNFIIARSIHELVPPITLAYWRWTIAALIMIPLSYKKLIGEWLIIKQNWKYLFAMGAFSVGSFNTLIYIAAHHTTVHHLSLISSLAPIIALIIVAILQTEGLSKNKILGAISAFTGSILVVTHGNIADIFSQEWNPGDLLLLLSAFIWGCWNVAMNFKPKNLSSRTLLTSMMIVGSFWILPFYIWETNYIAPIPLTLEAWLAYLYVSIFASIIAWFMWNYSIDVIGPIKTTLIYYSIPIFSGILAIALLNEPIKAYHIAGFILVFSGIVISNLRQLNLKIRKQSKDSV